MGVVIHNGRRKVIAAMAERIPLPNLVAEVEAMACKRAVQFASKIGVQEVIFEGDSMIVIQALTHGAANEAPYARVDSHIRAFETPIYIIPYKNKLALHMY